RRKAQLRLHASRERDRARPSRRRVSSSLLRLSTRVEHRGASPCKRWPISPCQWLAGGRPTQLGPSASPSARGRFRHQRRISLEQPRIWPRGKPGSQRRRRPRPAPTKGRSAELNRIAPILVLGSGSPRAQNLPRPSSDRMWIGVQQLPEGKLPTLHGSADGASSARETRRAMSTAVRSAEKRPPSCPCDPLERFSEFFEGRFRTAGP